MKQDGLTFIISTYGYLQIIYSSDSSRNFQVLPFFSWFLVAEALLACLAGSSLNFSAPHATTGPTAPSTKQLSRGMSGMSGKEFPKDQRQIQNLALPADQERFCLGGGYTFGRNRVSECNQHGRNKKIRKVLYF